MNMKNNNVPIQSIAGTAREKCSNPKLKFRNREELSKSVYEDFLKKGISKTNKGKPLELDVVKKEIDVITREIRKQIGAKIWKHYKVIETEEEFAIVLK